MENNLVKDVLLIDRGFSVKVRIDFKNMTFTRLQDKLSAKIERVDGNVFYLAGINPEIKNAVAFDDKFAIIAKVDAHNLVYAQPMGIWTMPKHKTIFFEVAKNACTSIVSEIYRSNWKKWWSPDVTEEFTVWNAMNWKNSYFKHRMMLSVTEYAEKKEQYKDHMKFLVYDEPLKRFIRMLNNKYIKHHTIASSVQPPYDKNINDYVDKVILATQLDVLNSHFWDQHLAPITLNGKDFLDDITYFVHLKDLNSFMKDKFDIEMNRYNAMPLSKKVVTEEILLPRQIEKIKEIYKEDYALTKKYQDKFYKA